MSQGQGDRVGQGFGPVAVVATGLAQVAQHEVRTQIGRLASQFDPAPVVLGERERVSGC